MTSYIDKNYYLKTYKGNKIPEDKIEEKLKEASMHIDNLTKFQQNIIQEVICKLADFEYENEDLIKTTLTSYSINGVSMGFGQSWNVEVQNGVAIPKDYYCLLEQTGLTCRCMRY